MGRLLFLLLIVVAAVLWWKHSQRGRRQAPPPPAPPPGQPEAMLRCAECGVHLPAHQALPGKGGAFCSSEHRERFEARS